MSILLTEINSIGTSRSLTKQEKILRGLMNCIEDGHYNVGDIIPSVNELSNNLGYARETIVKAYSELKNRGIIKSKQGVGYFVASTNLSLQQSVALILYGFQTFQQDYYNTFRKSLGKEYQIDIFFHHNNFSIYESIVNDIRGKYGMYVIAPIQNEEAKELLKGFNSERLLLIDRYQYINDKVSKITQEFEQSLIRVFSELSDSISRYSRVKLFYREDMDYPKGICKATKKYMKDNKIELKVYKEFAETEIEKGDLFFTIGDSDLWEILKSAKQKNLTLTEDFGILSHNDSPVKEIIEGGITTFSTDFRNMAVLSADFIKDKKLVNKIIPSTLIKRKSL